MRVRGQAVLRRMVGAGLGCVLVFSAGAAIKDADCLECHSDRTLTKTNATGKEIPLFVDAARLAASVHRTNTCASCHTDLTEQHPDDNRAARPVRCGACHEQAAQDLADSVHGRAAAAGAHDAPICTDCHAKHDIKSPAAGVAGWTSVDVCSRCHASERLNTRYNLPDDRVRTFFESYHGLASRFGSTLAANCASCHGFHKILPSTDPRSTIHTGHLVETCGQCHPGANEKFALGKIHVDLSAVQGGVSDPGHRINWWVRKIYLVLILGTIGGMLAHNFLLLVKKVAAHLRSAGRPIVRMNPAQRWQHAVLAASFIALAVTGFALKYPDSWLAVLMGFSEPLRRWAHRLAGAVLLLAGCYHLLYLAFSKDGRKLVVDFLPVKKDLADVIGTARWLLGLRQEKPQIGRFGYAEKLEYWAVIWGTIIMGVTGLVVWFKMEVTHWLPRWAVDVALTIHYYEAILACLAILVWHFYHVMFDPDVYPLNLACWDGRVSEHWQQEEHSLEQNPENVSASAGRDGPPLPPSAGH